MNGNQSLLQFATQEGMKMCSFIGYKNKSCITVQFSGFKLVNEKYHMPNLYSESDVYVWAQITHWSDLVLLSKY